LVGGWLAATLEATLRISTAETRHAISSLPPLLIISYACRHISQLAGLSFPPLFNYFDEAPPAIGHTYCRPSLVAVIATIRISAIAGCLAAIRYYADWPRQPRQLRHAVTFTPVHASASRQAAISVIVFVTRLLEPLSRLYHLKCSSRSPVRFISCPHYRHVRYRNIEVTGHLRSTEYHWGITK